MTRIAVVETTMRGMTVVAARLPQARSCVGVLAVPAGYADDPAGRAGTAHLTEHVCVATAECRESVQMAARTEPTVTRYSARVTPGSTTSLVRTLMSLFAAAPHSAELHEHETRAVLTENARLADQPQLHVALAVAARAFPTADAAIRDTTTDESITAVTPADIVGFRQLRYRPEGSVLCLVGPDDPGKLPAEVEAAMPTGLPGATSRVAPPAEPYEVSGWSDSLIWACLAPTATTETGLLARQVATELLVGSGGVLDEASAAAGTRSTGFATLPGRRADLLVVAWPAGPHTDRLVGELRRRRSFELANARARLGSHLAFELQSPAGIASLLIRYALGTGPWPEACAFDAVSDVHVTDVAVRMLDGATWWQIVDGRLGEVARVP